MSTTAQGPSKTREEGERNRLKILRALVEKGGSSTTTDIKSDYGIKTETTNYHCGRMEDEEHYDPPLVQDDGKERINSGVLNDPNRWRITEHGRQVVEELEDEQLSIEEASSFVELRTELARTNEQLEELQEKYDGFVKAVQKMVESGEIDHVIEVDHDVAD